MRARPAPGARRALRRVGSTAGWSLALAAAVVTLTRLGRGSLAAPPLSSLHELGEWAAERDPAEQAAALLRLAALGLAWYLVGLTALACFAQLAGARSVARWAIACAPRWVRPALMNVAGAGVAAGTAVSLLVPSGPVTARDPHARATLLDVPDVDAPGTATMRRLAPGERPAPAPPPETPRTTETWTIAPGEHLWSIASDVLADAWQRRPRESEIAPYWRRLIARNRTMLVDPDNPDLVFAGQVLQLPPVPPAPVVNR